MNEEECSEWKGWKDDAGERFCPYCGPETAWKPGVVSHAECIHWKNVDAVGRQTGASMLVKTVSGWRAVEGRQSDLRVIERQGHGAADCLQCGCGHTSLHNFYRIFERKGYVPHAGCDYA